MKIRDLLATYYLFIFLGREKKEKILDGEQKKVASTFPGHLEKLDMVNIKKILIVKYSNISTNRSMHTRFGLTLQLQDQ